MPRPCVFCKGGSDAADIMGSYVASPSALLRGSSPALYHVFLFSSQTAAARREAAGYVPENSGPGPPALPLRGRRLCGDAGTYSSLTRRTGSGDTINGDAGIEAALGAGIAAPTQERGCASDSSIRRSSVAHSVVAGPVL